MAFDEENDDPHGECATEIMRLTKQVGELSAPIPMLLWCPQCGERHEDAGEFFIKPHHTHACQHCGMVWRPCVRNTVGVTYLPGFKDRGVI